MGPQIPEGPILKPFSNVKNWSNFVCLLILYTFFCYFPFLCLNPSHYFPLLSFYAHLSSFNKQYKASSFLSFCTHLFSFLSFCTHLFSFLSFCTHLFSFLSFCTRLFSFSRLYKVSSLHFHSTRLRLEHHHRHRSSSCASLKFFIFCYQLFSSSFSFSILLPHLLSSWFQFFQFVFLNILF